MRIVYHVTPKENVAPILEEGLRPGWGDDGLGVYVFSSLVSAQAYADRGGWLDEDPQDMRILEIEADEGDLEEITPHPEWKNPEFYLSVLIRPMEDEDEVWTPAMRLMRGADGPEPWQERDLPDQFPSL